jgi:deoxycytidine triphosphate deaminase
MANPTANVSDVNSYTCTPGKVAIKNLISNGELVIDAYNDAQANPASYDVTLSEYYFIEQPRQRLIFAGSDQTSIKIPVFNPYIESDVHTKWGLLETAHTISEILALADSDYKEYNITRKSFRDSDDIEHDRVIVLPPNGVILALTNEKVGGVKNYAAQMKSKSSIGRCCVRTCNDAGWGDPGYFDRWTMEIKNESQEHATFLYVGSRVAQIFFLKVDEVGEGNRYTEISTSKYISDKTLTDRQNIEKLMLPKLYKTVPSPKIVKSNKQHD